MQVKRTLFFFILLLCTQIEASNKERGLDKNPSAWLLQQIKVGEAQLRPQLIEDSLNRLEQIEPNSHAVLVAYARLDFFQENRVEALKKIRQLKTLTPNSNELKELEVLAHITGAGKQELQRARLFTRAGNHVEAKKIYDSLFNPYYGAPQYRFEYIQALAQDDQQWHMALGMFIELRKSYPNTPRFEIAYATHRLKRDPSDTAAMAILRQYAGSPKVEEDIITAWINALNRQPLTRKTRARYDYLVTTFHRSNRVKTARDDFIIKYKRQLALEADPYYQAWRRAERYMDKEQFSTAKKFLNKAIFGRPNDANVIGSMGLYYLRTADYENAIRYFKRAEKAAEIGALDRWVALQTTAKFWQLIGKIKVAIASEDYQLAKQLIAEAQALNESPNTVRFQLAELYLATGERQKAIALFQQVLKEQPNNESALQGLLAIVSAEKDLEAMQRFTSSLSQRQNKLIASDIKAQSATLYRAQADDLSLRGEPYQAIAHLEKAIQLTPQDPWLYFDIAKLWVKVGDVQQGRSVYNKVLWQQPLNGEIRYTHALFLRSIDDYQGAIDSLAFVRLKDKTDDIIKLNNELKLNLLSEQVTTHIERDQLESATQLLNEIEQNYALSPYSRAQLAPAWYDVGEQDKAIAQLHTAIQLDPQISDYYYQVLSRWYAEHPENKNASSWFSNIHTLRSNESQQQELENYALQFKLSKHPDQIEQIALDHLRVNPTSIAAHIQLAMYYLKEDEFEKLAKRYEEIRKLGTMPIELEIEIAATSLVKGETEFGEYVTAHLVDIVAPDAAYQQQQIMDSLIDFDSQEKALNYAERLLALSPFDANLLQGAGSIAQHFKQQDLALSYYIQAIARAQNMPLPESVGRKEALKYTEPNSEDAWYITKAKSGIETITASTDGHFALAFDFAGQTSTQSDAELGVGGILAESYFNLWQGQGFVKVDAVSLAAQTSRFTNVQDASLYGTGLLCFNRCDLLSITPKDRGVAIGLGWQNEQWRFDLGTTPQGFIYSDWVGGIVYESNIGDFSWDIEIEKRALTNSVLSYAGLEDVTLGRFWGGVMSSGVTLGLYHDEGGPFGFWSSLDYQQYRGHNVLDNSRYRAMLGGYYRIIQDIDLELTTGLSFLHWAYEYNLSEETFGHGGYYSPQNYKSISLPITLDGRFEDLVYQLRVAGSYSQTKTETIAYFPNDPMLQAQAESIVSETGISPYFAGSEDDGFSYSLSGMVEYKLAPHWLIGATFSLDRADFYEPNYGQIYFKYLFNPLYRPLPLTPRPIVPYSSF